MREITFTHEFRVDSWPYVEVRRCVFEYEASDPSVGLDGGWFLVSAARGGESLDRDEVAKRHGWPAVYGAEEYAAHVAEDRAAGLAEAEAIERED